MCELHWSASLVQAVRGAWVRDLRWGKWSAKQRLTVQQVLRNITSHSYARANHLPPHSPCPPLGPQSLIV